MEPIYYHHDTDAREIVSRCHVFSMNARGRVSAERILEALADFYGFKSDTALAQHLGYTQGSALANLRKRDSIDLERVIQHCPDVDLQTLVRYGVARRVRDAPFMHLNVDTGEILSQEEYEKQLKEFRKKRSEQSQNAEE